MSSGTQPDAGGGSRVVADGTAVEETTPETAATATATEVQRGVDDDDDDDDDECNAGDIVNSGLPVLTVYMPSDNDGESASSSGSPVPAAKTRRGTVAVTATAGKGILVHKNKKSSNTNRVSFVTNSSSSSSTPSPKRSKKKRRHHNRQQDDNVGGGGGDNEDHQAPYYARTGRRLTGFGVKSYLHDFYDDPEDYSSIQDDDFKYHVDPEFRWRRHCCGAYAILGLVVTAMGAAVMVAGHLIPAKDPLVNRSANMEVIDRWAVAFNEHLASCRYVGSVVFGIGVVFSVVRFWVSVIRDDNGRGDGTTEKKLSAIDDKPAVKQQQQQQTVRIPITGTVENVQPDPRSINLQLGGRS